MLRERTGPVVVRDLFGKLVEVARSRVVPQPLPRFAYPRGSRPRQVMQGGKAGEKLWIEIEYARDLCLLKHQLRDEYFIRVARVPPGEVAMVLAVPGAQLFEKACACARVMAGRVGMRCRERLRRR